MDQVCAKISFVFLILFFDNCYGLFHTTYTDAGTIIGKIDDVFYKGKTYKMVNYLGIPYSEEVKEWMRFRKLHFREPFKKPYNATYFRPACLQTGQGSTIQKTSEDCLFLNIYAPAESSINPKKKYPVIIYMHGGNFKSGSASEVSPEILSIAGDLIVVTLNYRLGIFGFLNSGNSFARGNYGLWDQHLAIRWIRYNIASFGGNVENITLMGQAAGAASVMFQAMYPGNRGLIQRVIAMSGTSVSPWALHGTNLRDIAKELECLDDHDSFSFSDEPLVNCIKNKPADDILAAGLAMENIGPTIDGDFLIAHPYEILNIVNNSFEDANDFFRSLDIIVGTNDYDGGQILEFSLSIDFGLTGINVFSLLSDEVEQVLIPKLLEPVFKKQELFLNYTLNKQTRNNVLYSTLYQYTNWTDPDSSQYIRENLLRLSTDVNFVVPIVQLADGHSYTNYNSSTYVYQFTHKPTYNIDVPVWLRGASAGVESFYIFGFPERMIRRRGLTRESISKREYQLAENMMQWIANFARTGNPNEPRNLVGFGNTSVLWPRYSDERPYLRISANMSSVASPHTRFGEPATSFWTTLVPVLLRGSPPPQYKGNQDGNTTFTAFRIRPEKIEIVIISFIIVSCGLLIITLLLLICACRSVL
ncbi:carboxylesterase 5A-like [Mercenaria mercenaria]|uniref:carboxylesterase 5A-like n=1 Tax=Mercenaria mercenaria TaxID=6596 RepID=UPI00234F651C|nr:carboxylesterase 5A-like [Mercenaria mercenaria]